jgi:hypothetical protein
MGGHRRRRVLHGVVESILSPGKSEMDALWTAVSRVIEARSREFSFSRDKSTSLAPFNFLEPRGHLAARGRGSRKTGETGRGGGEI